MKIRKLFVFALVLLLIVSLFGSAVMARESAKDSNSRKIQSLEDNRITKDLKKADKTHSKELPKAYDERKFQEYQEYREIKKQHEERKENYRDNSDNTPKTRGEDDADDNNDADDEEDYGELSCIEGDNGFDIFNFAYALYDNIPGSIQNPAYDFCKTPEMLVENQCNADNHIQVSGVNCEFGCFMGQCLEEVTDLSCEDTDGGANEFVYGEATGVFPSDPEYGVYTGTREDTCVIVEENVYVCDVEDENCSYETLIEELEENQCFGEGCAVEEIVCKSVDSYKLNHYPYEFVSHEYIPCEYGCQDGKCLTENELFFDLAINDFKINSEVNPASIEYGTEFQVSFDIINLGNKVSEDLAGVQIVICNPDETNCHIPNWSPMPYNIPANDGIPVEVTLPMVYHDNIVNSQIKIMGALVGLYNNNFQVYQDFNNDNNVVGEVVDVTDVSTVQITDIELNAKSVKDEFGDVIPNLYSFEKYDDELEMEITVENYGDEDYENLYLELNFIVDEENYIVGVESNNFILNAGEDDEIDLEVNENIIGDLPLGEYMLEISLMEGVKVYDVDTIFLQLEAGLPYHLDLDHFPNILNNNSCNYDDLWFIVGENGLAEDIIAMNYVMGAITAYVENSAWCNPNIFNLGYELGNNQFLDNYFTLGKSANDVDSMLTEAELKMLKDEEFEYELVNDFGEKIEYEIEYKQRIRFENEENFIFTYEDNPGFPPEYSYYIAIDDSPSKPMYSYEVMFDNSVVFDINNFDEFEDQLVPLRFEMQGGIDAYITDLINDGSEITGMTFFAGDYTWLTFNEQKQVENKFGDLLDIEFVDYVINPETNEMVSAGFTINGLNVWIDVGTMESAFGLDFAFVYGSSEEEDLEEDKKVCKMILNAREIKLEEGKEVRINDEKISDISGFYATSHFIGNPGQWYGFSYQVNPDNDMIYFQMNDQIIDPVLEQFKFVFYDIAGSPEESENFELTASDNSGQLIFHNTDDMQVKLKVELDVDGNVYWGKLHTSDEVDEMYYFNGDVCAGQTEITECKGAMFLVSSGEEHEAHFVKLDKIDTVDHKISFEDKTYGTETNELSFISCVDQYVHLSGISDDLLINICEANNTVSFKSLGQGYSDDNSFVQFKTKNQGIVKLSLFDNDNTHPKVGDISFTESTDVDSVDHFIDGSSLENSLIFNFYYDLVNNALEINHNTEWENGADWINDFDNLNDDKLFVSSLKGTFISLDNDDSPQSVYIQHPQFDELYYARVFVAEADATTDVYSPNFGVDQIKLDTEVTQEEITNKNIVLVGRPTIYAGNNANPLIDNYELPELNPGDGFIGLRDNGNIDDNGWFKPLTALIVSGNTPQDVLNAGHIFNDYKYYDLDEVGQEAIVNDINGELVLIY